MRKSNELKISNLTTTPAAISIGIGDLVQQADKDQKALEAKLANDRTRTKASRELFAAEAASKRLKQLWTKCCHKQEQIKKELGTYQKRIDSLMELRGTTDILLLTNYGQLIQDMDIPEICELGRQGDSDALRACLLLPALRFKEKFKINRELLETELKQQTLGNDYQAYTNLQEQLEQANRLEVGLLETSQKYDKAAKQIQETVVDQSEMPEPEPALG